MPSAKTAKPTITTEDFDRILEEIIDEEGAALLTVPGVYEATSEHFNNDVIARWTAEQEGEGDDDAEKQTAAGEETGTR